jgi:hypothetical protein
MLLLVIVFVAAERVTRIKSKIKSKSKRGFGPGVGQSQNTLVIRKPHVKLSAPLGILHVSGQPTLC